MITRRDLNRSLLALGACAMSAGGRGQDARGSVVRTRYGKIEGVSENGVTRFLGIPYGAPTSGANRFMPPRELESWSGVRSATRFGVSCPQVSLGVSPFAKPDAAKPSAPSPMQLRLTALFASTAPEPSTGEDCLVLNVLTPAPDTKLRPVMVWLHGGGFAVGSGSTPGSDGTRLAQRGDVVVVTINHRLNVFGHLYLGEVAGEDFALSGNVGMLDAVQALTWVRDNIASFGGDPANVTIFGESGGAGKVSVICAMPAAKGLFQRAIMQSGPCLRINEIARGTEIAKQLLKDLGIAPGKARSLQSMEPGQLARAAAAAEVKVVPRVFGFGPSGLIPLIDGLTLTHHPFDERAAPESSAVPFLVGSTKDEATLFAGPLPQFGSMSADDVKAYLVPMAGKRAAAAYALYAKLYPSESPSYLLVNAVTDFWMRQAADQVAQLKARDGKTAFVYVVGWEIDRQLRSPHGADVYLAFDNVAASAVMNSAPNAQTVADQMADAWIAFARSGNPNTRPLPHWPAYDPVRRANMVFNVTSRVVEDYGRPTREFWTAKS